MEIFNPQIRKHIKPYITSTLYKQRILQREKTLKIDYTLEKYTGHIK